MSLKERWSTIWRVAVNLVVAALGFQEPVIIPTEPKDKPEE